MPKYTKRVAVYCVCPKCLWFAEENVRDRGSLSGAVNALTDRMVGHLDGPCEARELMLEVREYHEMPPDEGLERRGARMGFPRTGDPPLLIE